jgi:AraC-like DNA-binding protein
MAHRALILATPATTTVTEVATDCGFWELGRFSVAYRALFGEVPSLSLRRSQEHVFLADLAPADRSACRAVRPPAAHHPHRRQYHQANFQGVRINLISNGN